MGASISAAEPLLTGGPAGAARVRALADAATTAMAGAAALRLEHRWSDWGREPFGADSPKHVSVYVRA